MCAVNVMYCWLIWRCRDFDCWHHLHKPRLFIWKYSTDAALLTACANKWGRSNKQSVRLLDIDSYCRGPLRMSFLLYCVTGLHYLHFYSPQPDTSLCCKITHTGLVHHMRCQFIWKLPPLHNSLSTSLSTVQLLDWDQYLTTKLQHSKSHKPN